MKKVFVLFMALALTLAINSAPASFMAAAQAEEAFIQTADPAPLPTWMDLFTQIAVWLITGLAGFITFALNRWAKPFIRDTVQPWIRQMKLEKVADGFVKYFEDLIGRHLGEDKWERVMEALEAEGYDIHEPIVVAAVQKAWHDMNLGQILVGLKEPPDEPEDND